jgi:hypothetical protein
LITAMRRRMMKGKQFSLDSRLDMVQYCVVRKEPALTPCTEVRAVSEPSANNEELEFGQLDKTLSKILLGKRYNCPL